MRRKEKNENELKQKIEQNNKQLQKQGKEENTRKRERVAGIKIKEKGKLKQIDGKRKN